MSTISWALFGMALSSPGAPCPGRCSDTRRRAQVVEERTGRKAGPPGPLWALLERRHGNPAAAAALAFGLVHGGVRFLDDQIWPVVTGPGERDTYAGADPDRTRRQDKRVGQGHPEPVGDRLDLSGPVDVFAHHDELVARVPGHGISRSDKAAQTVGDLDQELVANV